MNTHKKIFKNQVPNQSDQDICVCKLRITALNDCRLYALTPVTKNTHSDLTANYHKTQKQIIERLTQ